MCFFFFGELSVDAECFSISDACRSFIAMEEKVIYVSRIIVAFDFNCTATMGQSNLEAMPKDWCHRKYCHYSSSHTKAQASTASLLGFNTIEGKTNSCFTHPV